MPFRHALNGMFSFIWSSLVIETLPMKKKRTVASQAAARGPLPELPGELLDQLVRDRHTGK